MQVCRNRYARLKDFHREIFSLLKSIFKTNDISYIEVYYHYYNTTIVFNRQDILEGKYDISKLKKKRISYYEKKQVLYNNDD